ncbi:hypothetical protein COW36_10995 [bacterium (Candidatus Blackallbacteria) CG17_big_fil_post_rev_8_21_14_2_50_48_46]|uniref:PatA-like N-terminal domain-containing protein n=1 Tax=bacterium (Candidatus Blackallbacteria) CG17_big_fil_post_rev_8_21_14_2_50_48_46 TaxID=2014261 RepID=A0A2M7G4U4_9BACT|nr:MAG: hypothetical protein COW64_18090 [bacterium (Candidatus Blackallbacteria) CG18_big_fil_WC_8_21_14_2_50_49_26]PIW16801.1 MAG: hypothetical protein COW36_10995 [bacterium (Candidatus Blackallbacteria) CG17_big_fil_post_rev_8_21_14_2_50_48_46]PIW47998.1 MAG: hypothetical protein COW20_10710 [bacterium (Candidatus Blackallbacteria) CG13_big_fil_rev_8_21_14_2_50_49_14]
MTVLLEGDLAYISLFNLLQFIKLEQKDCLFKVEVKEVAQEAYVYFEMGRIMYARLNRLTGPDAMYRLIGWWSSGHFQMTELTRDELPLTNIEVSLDAVLMESARYMDEFADLREVLPTLTSGVRISSNALQMVQDGRLPDFTKLLPRSFTVARFFEICPYNQWDSLKFLKEMITHKAFQVGSGEDLRSTVILTPIDSLESIVMEFVGIEDSHIMIEEVLQELGFDRFQKFGFNQLLSVSDKLMERIAPQMKNEDEVQEAMYRLRARITSLL